MLVRFGVAVGDTAQAVRVGELRFRCGEQDGLIAAQPSGLVHRARGGLGVAHVVLGADDEGNLSLVQRL